jgi:hypothetical protein
VGRIVARDDTCNKPACARDPACESLDKVSAALARALAVAVAAHGKLHSGAETWIRKQQLLQWF